MKTLLLSAAFTFFLFSCEKSTEIKSKPQPAQEDILGKYKITKLLFQSKGHPDQDLLSTLPVCEQDDLAVFAANSIFRTEDAGVSCGQDEEEPTTWFIKGNKITIDGMEGEIVSFDKHRLVLTTPMEFFGTQGTVLETLEKQ